MTIYQQFCLFCTSKIINIYHNCYKQMTQKISTFQSMFLIFVLLVLASKSIYIITDFGALPHQDHRSAHIVNAKAFISAVLKANSTQTGQRIVKVPKGTFYSFPMRMDKIHNVTIIIQGKLSASKLIRGWPTQPQSGYYQDFISCHDCSHLTIHGGGKIDGRGYHWWVVCILNIKSILKDNNYRPHLIRLQRSTHIVIHDITMKNSAQFHLKMDQCYDAQLYNIAILVNTTAQINLLKRLSIQGIVPLFPLNTDGIDPSGARMHIYNLTVQNFDDVVVPKPSHQGYMGGNCTQDMLIQNARVVLGVGMTIGSVPPDIGCNCIRNITFRNVHIYKALKGINVKSNPGDQGTGLVQNIYYYNFTMIRPLWWAIYIGPQQMKQPDGDGPGCMLYPFDKHGTCTTQPRVTFRNITLENIKIENSLLYPVTIRCNVSNPCEGINFINVRTDKWDIGQKEDGHVCEYASGIGEGNVPVIDCLTQKRSTTNTNTYVNTNNQKLTKHTNEKKQPTKNNRNRNNLKFQYQHQNNDITWKDYLRLLAQMQKAALEVGYHEQDDEFDYDFNLADHYSDQNIENLIESQK